MLKYFVVLFLFGVAAFVWHYNATHTGSYMLLPLLDLVPALEGDIPKQADWSWRIVVGVGVFVLLLNIYSDLRRLGRKKKAADDAE